MPAIEKSPKKINLVLKDIPTERALGVTWDPQDDTKQLKATQKEIELTKWELLSFTSSIYDLIGIIVTLIFEPTLII